MSRAIRLNTIDCISRKDCAAAGRERFSFVEHPSSGTGFFLSDRAGWMTTILQTRLIAVAGER